MRFSNVQDLAGPPLLERLLLVSPIPTALAVFFLGVLIFEVLRRRGKGGAAWGAFVAGVVVGAAILLVGARVETTHETIRRMTERLVALAVGGDRDRVEEMVSGRLVIVLSPEAPARGADWMLDRVEALGGVVESNSTRWRGAEVRSPSMGRGRITLHTTIEAGLGSGEYPSTWDFVWQRAEGGTWRVVKIEALSVMGRKPWRGLGGQIPPG